MLDRVLTLTGIIVMAISFIVIFNLVRKVKTENRNPGFILFLLMIFFLIGYCFYFYSIMFKPEFEPPRLLVSAILCFGSFFVILVLTLANNYIDKLNYATKKIEENNALLSQETLDLSKKNTELENTKDELDNKNKKLEETMGEFYTYRVSLDKDNKKTKKENKQIAEKIIKVIKK